MTDSGAHRTGESPLTRSAQGPEDLSLGELVSRMTSDVSTLLRQELELAKVELKEEAVKAGKGAGMLGGTAVTGLLAVLLLSFAAAWGLAEIMPTGVAFLLVGLAYVGIAGALFVVGKKELKTVHGPQKTVQTVKEDAQWARDQMS